MPTMPSSGQLNMAQTTSPVSVAYALGRGLTSTISMNDSDVRSLAGVGGSGTTWSMNSLYGKSPGGTVNISDLTGGWVSYLLTTTPVTVTLTFGTNGSLQMTSTGTTAGIFNGGSSTTWLTPLTSGIGSNYWITWTLIGTLGSNGSATPSSGRVQLSTARSIVVSKSSGGGTFFDGEYDIEIWDAASGGTRVGYAPGMTITALRTTGP